MGEHTAAVEAWLGSAGFDEASEVAYVMARGGSGSFDRNISPLVLEQVVAALHTQLPAGLVLPAPDRNFIRAGAARRSTIFRLQPCIAKPCIA
jgi:hypothetical protein